MSHVMVVVLCTWILQDGDTALHMSAYWGHTACTQLLLEAGSDLNIKNNVRRDVDS